MWNGIVCGRKRCVFKVAMGEGQYRVYDILFLLKKRLFFQGFSFTQPDLIKRSGVLIFMDTGSMSGIGQFI